jgi:hypothetical protein
MIKQLALAATVAASLTVATPAAHAAVVREGCGFDSLAQETLTGGQDTFTGAAFGYAVFDDQGSHTLRCYVTVDGSEQASTPTGSGSVVVTTQGQVTYTAPGGSSVEICTEIDGTTVTCEDGGTEIDLCFYAVPDSWPLSDCPPYIWPFPIPPIVGDALGPVLQQLDTVVCPILASLAPGIPGVVDIAPEGDVTLAVLGPVWDCPPYGNLFAR